ncbi:universal stress protein [Zooshikella ganghwensis]|uniref:universal stress protein n=1 Tax=Zooshikella ganghwensis TaxID=202772 RepID=UPI0003F81706|nr:universal stress protein [Zooshikella ganghwensis]
MNEFKNILVAITHTHYNNDEIDKAIKLAKANNAKLTIVAIDEPISRLAELAMETKLKRLFTHQLDEVVNEFRNKVNQAGVSNCDTRILWGKAYTEIIRLVQKENFDLVIKLADPFINFSRKKLTGDDLNLLRKCPVPVWLLVDTGTHTGDVKKILVAIDSDFDNDERVKLNKRLLSYADSLFTMEQAEELHIIQVWGLYGEERLRGPFINMPEEEIDEMLEKTRSENERAMNNLINAEGMDKPGVIPHLIKGSASEEIQRLAQKEDVDMIVMGTVGRTGLAGFVIGNTAENVLNEASCSVLAVKPEGFAAPTIK